ncbi:aminotransferase class V-fold PLP-dependent enzyme, partial [Bradyrhizobium ottawaense]
FDHLEGEAIAHRLNRAGIAVSLGSACRSGSMQPSHVLRAMQVPAWRMHGAVRFSLSRETSLAEVDEAVCAVSDIVTRMRASSRATVREQTS